VSDSVGGWETAMERKGQMCQVTNSIAISGALLKYFGASSATGQDEPPTSPTTGLCWNALYPSG